MPNTSVFCVASSRHQADQIVKAGNILISVHTEDAGDIARARDIFEQAGAQDLCTAGEASPKDTPAPRRASRPASAAVSFIPA